MTWQKGLGRGDDGQPGDDDITAWLGDPSEEPGWTCLGAQVRHSVNTLRDGFGRAEARRRVVLGVVASVALSEEGGMDDDRMKNADIHASADCACTRDQSMSLPRSGPEYGCGVGTRCWARGMCGFPGKKKQSKRAREPDGSGTLAVN